MYLKVGPTRPPPRTIGRALEREVGHRGWTNRTSHPTGKTIPSKNSQNLLGMMMAGVSKIGWAPQMMVENGKPYQNG